MRAAHEPPSLLCANCKGDDSRSPLGREVFIGVDAPCYGACLDRGVTRRFFRVFKLLHGSHHGRTKTVTALIQKSGQLTISTSNNYLKKQTTFKMSEISFVTLLTWQRFTGNLQIRISITEQRITSFETSPTRHCFQQQSLKFEKLFDIANDIQF